MSRIVEKEGYKKPIVNCVIMDLDGCIADDRRRRIHIPDWPKYYADILNDSVFPEQLFLWHRIQREVPIFIFTGRPEYLHNDTKEWLRIHGLEYAKMFMRPDKSKDATWKLKSEWLSFIQSNGVSPSLVYEDDPSCCSMFAGAGLVVHQVLRSAQ